jgi:hypothetical protein
MGGAACGFVGHHFEKHRDDIESESIVSTAAGGCSHVEIVAASQLFDGPYEFADDRPVDGTRVAFEGMPQGQLACTQLGCEWECCENSCGYAPECTFSLRPEGDEYNRLCLSHADFACGGTDCSPWCAPFSTEPEHRYRFVGTIHYDGSRARLDVDEYCRID